MSFNNKASGIQIIDIFPNSTRKAKISGNIASSKTGQRRIVLLDRRTMAIVGTTMSFPDNTWEITTEFPLENELLILCLDETGEYNSDSYDRVSLCNTTYQFSGEVWKEAIIGNMSRFKRYFFPCTHRDKFSWETEVTPENIKGELSDFQFTTALTKGFLEDSLGNPLKLGRENNSLIVPGTVLSIGNEETFIRKITGDGDSSDGVVLDRVVEGHEFVDDLFGDGSCVMFYPLINDFKDRISGNLARTRGVNFDDRPLPFENVRSVKAVESNRYGMIDTGVRLAPGSFTFSFWGYVPSRSTALFLFGQIGSFYLGYSGAPSTTSFYRTTNDSGISYGVNTTVGILNSNHEWQHVVLVWDAASGEMHVYMNGNFIRTNTTPIWIETINPTIAKTTFCIFGLSDHGFLIGNSLSDWRCLMWRVFNRTVTAGEVTALYNERPTFLGEAPVVRASNVLNKYSSVFSIEHAVGLYSTCLVSIKGENRPLLYTEVNKVEINLLANANHQKCLFKGSYLRGRLIKAYSILTILSPPRIEDVFSDSVGSEWYFSWNAESFTGVQWISLDLERKRYVSGVAVLPTHASTFRDYPTKIDIYSSDTGLFKGEEKFRGQVSLKEGYFQSQYTNIGRTESPFHARYIKMAVRDRTYDRTSSPTSGSCGMMSMVVEVLEPYSKEAMKARSIILDIEDNWGDASHVGVRSVCPVLNDMPLSTEGWEFYETSKHVSRNGADRVFNGAYPFNRRVNPTNPTQWLSASGQTANQRLIGVALEDFYFDDVLVVNYHDGFSSNSLRGAKNITVTVCPEEYIDLTYGAPVPSGKVIYKGEVPRLYTGATSSLDGAFIGDGFFGVGVGGHLSRLGKTVRARSVVLDFSGNHGHLTNMGFRKIEFYLKGVRRHIVTAGTHYFQVIYSSGLLGDAEAAFKTSTALTSSSGWYTSTVGPGRIGILFLEPIEFDMVRLVNQHVVGAQTDCGVSDVTIYGSMSTDIPPNTYSTPWNGSFTIVPFMGLRRFYPFNNTNRSYFEGEKVWIFPRYKDCWTARSVVFTFLSNHGGRGIGVQQIQFIRKGIVIPYRIAWDVYNSGSDINYAGVNAFRGEVDPFVGAVANQAWHHNNHNSGRLIVAFDGLTDFDEIRISNWWDTSVARYQIQDGVWDVRVEITNVKLTAEYSSVEVSIPESEMIEETQLPLREDRYNWECPNFIVLIRKDTGLYSWDIDLLVQSDTVNDSVSFQDNSRNGFPVIPYEEVKHTTTQAKIGATSINVSGGYLRIPNFRRLCLGRRSFEFCGYIYPLSTTGRKGIISNWSTASKGFMIAVNDGHLEVSYSTDGTNEINCTSVGTIPINQWTGFSVYREGENLYIDFDDVLDSIHSMGTDSIYSGMAEWLIGSYGASLLNCFNGMVDEIVVKSSLMAKTETLPTILTPIITSLEDPEIRLYVAVSFDKENTTFSIWEDETWVPILTKDEAVHGVVGDEDWYFRNDNDSWEKDSFVDCMESFAHALKENPDNKMERSVVEELTSSQWEQTNGFSQSKGVLNLLLSFYKEGKTYVTLEDFKVNDKRYWLSEPIELEKIDSVLNYAKISWSLRYTEENKILADNFVNGFKVFARITGYEGWFECSQNCNIPGIDSETDLIGLKLYIKTELDLTMTKYPRVDVDPVIFLEIN